MKLLKNQPITTLLTFMLLSFFAKECRFAFSDWYPSPNSDILVHFNGMQALFTLAGAWFGKLFCTISFIVIQVFRYAQNVQILENNWLLLLPSLGLPTLASLWYFASKSPWTLLVPIGAFILFNVHPIGHQAWAYSLYWVIPIICYFYGNRFIFMKSLGASFSAHALGSVIWLYCFEFSANQWLDLIPVVMVERLSMAIIITCVFKLVSFLATRCQTFYRHGYQLLFRSDSSSKILN